MKMEPLISVIMCTYNEEQEELEQALRSILQQTYTDFELIVVLDDPDNRMICRVVEQYAKADERIRVIRNERNLGFTESSNRAWRAAKGVYIARMDADDIAASHRLETELHALLADDLDFVAASKRNIDRSGACTGQFVNCLNPEQMKKLLPYDNLVNHSTVLMKKSVLQDLGGYAEIPSCEDYDLWLRMLCIGYRMAILPDILLEYRIRENSITFTDPYKQYLSACFVRRMYRSCSGKQKLWTVHDFERYADRRNRSGKKRLRFNRAYRLYYRGTESMALGRYGDFIRYTTAGILRSPNVFLLFIRKVLFHIRKRIVLAEKSEASRTG